MTDRLSDADLLKLCEAATPGPWTWERKHEPGCVPVWTLRGPTALCRWWETTPDPAHSKPGDAAFIAAAREALPRLLAEKERLAKLEALVLDLIASGRIPIAEARAALEHGGE